MVQNNLVHETVFGEYEKRRENAKNRAFEIRESLLSDDAYSEVHYAIKGLSLDIAKAEYENDFTLAEHLKIQRTGLEKKRDEILKKKGLVLADLRPRFLCEKCGDTGYTKDGKLCECYLKTLTEVSERILNISAPLLPSFKTYLTKDGKDEALKKKLITYAEKFPHLKKRNLLFTGGTGTGKTFAAGCIANAVKARDFTVIWLSAAKLNDVCLRCHTAGMDDKKAIYDLVTCCDLLVIDDLGTEPILKNVTVEYLTSFISERLNAEKPFIITTNLNFDEIKARYTDRLLSRLCGEESARIEFSGQDKRLKGNR